MSRCFPFPPPGYVRNGARSEARSEALIESIKLQREIEKSKKDRKKEKKEKKREKKERRREKKEKKERKRKEGTTSLASDGKKFKLIDEPKEIKADGKLQKAEDYENEQFERSGITEEHDQPVSSREHCCLSDSTQSSGKRKRSASPSSQDHGAAIKIRLPLRKHRGPEDSKHREPEESKPEYQVGSSGRVGIADSYTQDSRGGNHQLQQAHVTNAETNHFRGKSDSRHCKQGQNLAHGDAQVTNKIPDDETGRMAYLYNSLFQNPLTCDVFNSEDDQDWLFRPERSESRHALKKVKCDADAFQCSTSSLWPRAQYIPEVDIYALPYTLPF